MSWQKLDEMPRVAVVLKMAEKEIKELTGKSIRLRMTRNFELNPEYMIRLRVIICDHFKVTWEEIQSGRRTNSDDLVDARHVYQYLAHRVLKFPQQDVAEHCNQKDHSSITYVCKKIDGFYDIGDPLSRDVTTIKNKLLL